jgi:hypothetical protein
MERHNIPGTGRFGRRTLILIHGGFTWVAFGWVVMTVPMERFSAPGPTGGLQFLDSPIIGILWVIGGACAVVNAPLRKRWGGRDVLGFLGLLTPPLAWFIAYIWSAIAYVASHGLYGNPHAGIGLIVWYLVSVFLLVIAGWPDPNDPTIMPVRRVEANDET